MKPIIYVLITTLFLVLMTGCSSDNDTPSGDQDVVSTTASSSNTNDDTESTEDTPDNQEEENTISTIKLFASPEIDKILLRWDTVNEETGYQLEWSKTSDTLDNSITLDTVKTEYQHQDLEPETTYYYRITAQFTDEQRNVISGVVAVKTGSVAEIIQSDVAY